MSLKSKNDHAMEETVVLHKPEQRNTFIRRRMTYHFPREEKRTKESFKNECDINRIVGRAQKPGGTLTDLIREDGRYGDFSNTPTYYEAMQRVRHAQEQFDALPASVRDRFNHDPGRFYEFVNEPTNGPELVKMGLAEVRPAPVDSDAVMADKIGKAVAEHTTKKAPPKAKPEEGDKP